MFGEIIRLAKDFRMDIALFSTISIVFYRLSIGIKKLRKTFDLQNNRHHFFQNFAVKTNFHQYD